MPLELFSTRTREWFESAFEAPTAAQEQAWPAIASGEHTLISAPTGSGKTLAAFLWAIDRLAQTEGHATRVVYVSPLKALSYDVERNLRAPLRGVGADVRKELDVKIHVPVESMVEPEQSTGDLDPLEPVVGGESTRRSIWPAIYPELLRLVREHRSTIVFVNNRRGAERLALRLNELAAAEDEDHDPQGPAASPEIARAHHGSLAREERLVVEEELKSGRLPCLVATSSLELGIDMGAVDLVLQVESPKSVSRGLQRIGRAGHNVGDVSRGRFFPKFRADLLEWA